MGQITWNTDVNAPCCPGEIVADDGRTLLIQTDWDFPSTASSFGWSLKSVQHCKACGSHDVGVTGDEPGSLYFCRDCEETFKPCDHDGTDGTVMCCHCGTGINRFIESAREWLDDHDGATADDPGYFDCEA